VQTLALQAKFEVVENRLRAMLALRIDFDEPAALLPAFPACFADVGLDMVGHRIDLKLSAQPLITDGFEMGVSIHREQSEQGGRPSITLAHPVSKIITEIGFSFF
jgi:hypothetical protein